MNKERTLLRNLKAQHKEEVASLKHFIRELSRRCKEHTTHKDYSDPALVKARHDSEYYKGRIKDINARLKELSSKWVRIRIVIQPGTVIDELNLERRLT